MNWLSFFAGIIVSAFAYVLFTSEEDEIVFRVVAGEQEEHELIVNGKKRYELSCQNCRKLKWHIEVKPRIFECMKCKRRTDLTTS